MQPIDPQDIPAMALADRIKTGDPNLDRDAIRLNVARAAIAAFGMMRALEDSRLAQALISIVWKETDGDPRQYLGDTTAPGGPSIGPGQVYRETAQDLGLWHPPAGASAQAIRAAYGALAHDEAKTLTWSAIEFAHHLAAYGGHLPEAIRAYNGAGPHAELYRDEVLAWAKAHGWDLSGVSLPRPDTSGVA